MKKRYSILLYQLMKSYQNQRKTQSFTLEELRVFFHLDDPKDKSAKPKYERWAEFKRKILDKAIEEINLITDLEISYSLVRKNRKISEILIQSFEKHPSKVIKAQKEIQERLEKSSKV